AAEHRDRRRRRRLSPDNRLGGGNWRCRMGGDRVVRDHLLLDSAAFLGVVAIPERRLCDRRGADAAGRRRPASDQAADAALYLVALARSRGALAPWCRGGPVRR